LCALVRQRKGLKEIDIADGRQREKDVTVKNESGVPGAF